MDGEELHRVNHGWLDSDTLKYTKEGLGKEYKDVLVTIIRDWLKIHIFHLGTEHGIDLYNTAIEEDGWTSVDVVDIYEKKLFGMKQT